MCHSVDTRTRLGATYVAVCHRKQFVKIAVVVLTHVPARVATATIREFVRIHAEFHGRFPPECENVWISNVTGLGEV